VSIQRSPVPILHKFDGKIQLLNKKNRQLKHLYWEIAEYISIGASALGTIAAALSHQAAYAATPVTLALSLNLVNRQQLQKQIALSRQQTEAIAQSIPPSPEPSIAKIRKILQSHKRSISQEKQLRR